MMKNFLRFLCIIVISGATLLIYDVARAETNCDKNYKSFGLGCYEKKDCKQEVADMEFENIWGDKQVGVYTGGDYFISGLCPGKATIVCCKPKATTGTGNASTAAATAPTTAPTDNGSSFIPKKPDGYNGPLPDCAFAGTCRNVNDVLELMVNWGQRIFGLIGSFALVMFVYGGFVMIFSAGNAEKVKQGRDILTAAVIGLVIAFSAYLLVDFILDALNVREEFRGVNL